MDSLKNSKEAQKPQSEFSRKKLLIEAAVKKIVDKPSPYVSTLVQKLADAEIRKNL
jgi:hypothetical protein